MGMIGPWQKRIVAYFFAGFLPLVIVYLALLLNLGVIVSFIGGFIISIGAMIIVHKVTLNALANFELNGQPVLQTTDSLGVLNYYNLSVHPEERIAAAKVDKKVAGTAYSTSNVFEAIFHKEKVPAWSDKTHMHIMIPKEDAYTHTFSMRGVPTFLYNRRGNWFWTKQAFTGIEDGLILENTVAYLAHSTKNFEESTRNYGRSAIDKLWEKFNTPQIWMLVIGLVVIVLLIAFGPKIIDMASGMFGNAAGPIAQASGALAPIEATQPLG